MKHVSKVLMGLVLTLAVMSFLPANAAKNPQKPLKDLMGENLAMMSDILSDLMTSKYDRIPMLAQAIRDHAIHISENRPDGINAKADIDRFNAHAFLLKSSSENLITVTEELIKHDKRRTSPGLLNIDYLRVVVAAHFSSMITTCVNCHNQFRR